MFTRFRDTGNRLQVSLVKPRRVDGKVRQSHIAGLGSIALPMTVESRLAFWRKVEDRLAKLGNVLGDRAVKIRGELFARIPIPSIDEQRGVQLANARAHVEISERMRDMYAESVAGHERHEALAAEQTAKCRAALAKVSAMLAADRERVAGIERGEDVSGGLGRPPDLIAIMRAAGMTDADIRHAGLTGQLADIIGAERLTKLQVEAAVAGSEAAERRFTKRLARALAKTDP
jgi:hypothetical protein